MSRPSELSSSATAARLAPRCSSRFSVIAPFSRRTSSGGTTHRWDDEASSIRGAKGSFPSREAT